MEGMKPCPLPSDSRCQCAFHQALNSAQTRNTFDIHKVEGVVMDGYFDMIHAAT